MELDLTEHTHRRLNLLTGAWVMVSPHRTKRPWLGRVEISTNNVLPFYDKDCYLCPGNKRAEGVVNPDYHSVYSFTNDFAALKPQPGAATFDQEGLLKAEKVSGQCKVICFSPRHDLTLPKLSNLQIEEMIHFWAKEFREMSADPAIRYIQFFENKGDIMGCSNPHPHAQVWSSTVIPDEVQKETKQQLQYFEKHQTSLLTGYLRLELEEGIRIVVENKGFAAIVPFWAVWPFEVIVISKRKVQHIDQFDGEEVKQLADILKRLTIRYDNLFRTSFPYSAGIHQAPVNGGPHPEWHWHMHFYPPLLRSESIKKFMVGYEMLANPQRDITPEYAAERLKEQCEIHYSLVP